MKTTTTAWTNCLTNGSMTSFSWGIPLLSSNTDHGSSTFRRMSSPMEQIRFHWNNGWLPWCSKQNRNHRSTMDNKLVFLWIEFFQSNWYITNVYGRIPVIMCFSLSNAVTFAIKQHQSMICSVIFRSIMQVTNVNDVRVYNLTCGQKDVPQVIRILDIRWIGRRTFSSSGSLMTNGRNWRKKQVRVAYASLPSTHTLLI